MPTSLFEGSFRIGALVDDGDVVNGDVFNVVPSTRNQAVFVLLKISIPNFRPFIVSTLSFLFLNGELSYPLIKIQIDAAARPEHMVEMVGLVELPVCLRTHEVGTVVGQDHRKIRMI